MPISGETRVFGLLGYPVAHSLSPAMYNEAFAALDYPGVYVAFPVEPVRVAEAVAGVRALGLGGANVTVPHKQAVIPHLDEVTPAARQIGAVNVIIPRDGRLIGDNTDGRGFLRSLREELGLEPTGARAVILGAGGAARAIAVELLRAGLSRLVIANRTLARAQELAGALQHNGLATASGEEGASSVSLAPAGGGNATVAAMDLQDSRLQEEVATAHLLIHTTTWGMAPHHHVPPLIPAHWLAPPTAVCDIVYAPAETSLLREARRRGCPTLPGIGMLLYQGVIALESWLERPAPVAVMREALLRHLS